MFEASHLGVPDVGNWADPIPQKTVLLLRRYGYLLKILSENCGWRCGLGFQTAASCPVMHRQQDEPRGKLSLLKFPGFEGKYAWGGAGLGRLSGDKG